MWAGCNSHREKAVKQQTKTNKLYASSCAMSTDFWGRCMNVPKTILECQCDFGQCIGANNATNQNRVQSLVSRVHFLSVFVLFFLGTILECSVLYDALGK